MQSIKGILAIITFALSLTLLGAAYPLASAPAPSLDLTPAEDTMSAQAWGLWDSAEDLPTFDAETMVSYVGTTDHPITHANVHYIQDADTYHVFILTPHAEDITLPAQDFDTLATLLPTCATEDASPCYWDAATTGNGQGTSTINLDQFTSITAE